jgi:hypothetical protein
MLVSKTNELERISCCNQSTSCESIIDNIISQPLVNSSCITSHESNGIDISSKSPSCRLKSLLTHECSFCTNCTSNDDNEKSNSNNKRIKVI